MNMLKKASLLAALPLVFGSSALLAADKDSAPKEAVSSDDKEKAPQIEGSAAPSNTSSKDSGTSVSVKKSSKAGTAAASASVSKGKDSKENEDAKELNKTGFEIGSALSLGAAAVGAGLMGLRRNRRNKQN
ncbi:MAG: hypothetical protein RLZ12_222 [Bacillota bacterium]|jgi:hypothetical protein